MANKTAAIERQVWYGVLQFNVTLNTVWVISETGQSRDRL